MKFILDCTFHHLMLALSVFDLLYILMILYIFSLPHLINHYKGIQCLTFLHWSSSCRFSFILPFRSLGTSIGPHRPDRQAWKYKACLNTLFIRLHQLYCGHYYRKVSYGVSPFLQVGVLDLFFLIFVCFQYQAVFSDRGGVQQHGYSQVSIGQFSYIYI